jgi:hypothetical protein
MTNQQVVDIQPDVLTIIGRRGKTHLQRYLIVDCRSHEIRVTLLK